MSDTQRQSATLSPSTGLDSGIDTELINLVRHGSITLVKNKPDSTSLYTSTRHRIPLSSAADNHNLSTTILETTKHAESHLSTQKLLLHFLSMPTRYLMHLLSLTSNPILLHAFGTVFFKQKKYLLLK